jgi:hypothetical protein
MTITFTGGSPTQIITMLVIDGILWTYIMFMIGYFIGCRKFYRIMMRNKL